MNPRLIIIILICAAVVGLGLQQRIIHQMREESAQFRAALEQASQRDGGRDAQVSAAEKGELERLRRENAELNRMRNELAQLRRQMRQTELQTNRPNNSSPVVAERPESTMLSPDELFLADNKNQPGVVTLPSGLQYKVLEFGAGTRPTTNSLVTVNYRGTRVDGTEFDSSYNRGKPATFPLTGVIPGWTEGFQLMPEGTRFQLFIPSHMAYGERGAGGTIRPNATLIFEVELVSIRDKSAP